MTNHVIRKERCPECAKLGGDRSGDNLAIYSDQSGYCFSCGYSFKGNVVKKYQQKQAPSTHKEVHLPHDITNELPVHAIKWLQQYGFTHNDRITHRVLWSDYHNRIIFPFFDNTGLIAWQGRYLGTENKAKWFSQGYIHDIVVPLNVTNRCAILVESFISAFVISKVHGAIPLFGSQTNAKHLLRLSKLVDKVYVWLDPDKRTESVKINSYASMLGLDTSLIWTDKKPHQMSVEEIKDMLTQKG